MRDYSNGALCALAFLFMASVGQAQSGASEPVKVRLYAEAAAISSGENLSLGVHFKLEPHWHIYWKNPGNSGLPVRIKWKLPEGFEVGPIQWPTPDRISLASLVTYGFENEVTLLASLSVPENLKPDQEIRIEAEVDWLMCKALCVPGKADLFIDLLVASKPIGSKDFQIFEKARAQLPKRNDQWKLSTRQVDGALELHIQGQTERLGDWYFFPEMEGVLDPNAEQVATYGEAGAIQLRLPLLPNVGFAGEPIRGVLTNDAGSWQVTLNDVMGASLPPEHPKESSSFQEALLNLGLPGWLVLAFAGGLILNIMPCVLPVLSLKVFSLVKHSGQSRRHAFVHGIAYTIGVVGSFLLLAGALFAFKALGEGVGWGFQLQSPGFVVILAILLFMFGLNMLGVFEIGIGLVGADTKVAQRNDLAGSFGMGVLAAVVGAPCMGPMIASVSGVAIQSSVSTGLLLFGVMGLGLASPFLFLAIFPKLAACLPKPGAWMEVFKQGMGFLLLLSVVFLAYVLGQQAGVDGIVHLLLVLVMCALAGWIHGRWGAPVKSAKTRRVALVLTLLLLVGAGNYGVTRAVVARNALMSDSALKKEGGPWAEWSEARVQAELDKGNSVFVDFTAAWCLICQANKLATRSDAITSLFQEHGIVSFEADWTRRDPAITKALEQFGRAGVPLYLLYTPDGEVVVLPQSLTKGIIRQAVEKAFK